MSEVDIATLKRAVTAADANYGALLDPTQRSVSPHSSHRRNEIEKIWRSYFVKTGLDVPKLEEILTEERNEVLRSIVSRKANAAKQGPIDKEAILARMVNRPPFTNPLPTPGPSRVLDPFSIVPLSPQTFTTYLDMKIQSGFNWVYFDIDADRTFIAGDFIFYFNWHNYNGDSAYVDVATTLTFSGLCIASGDDGVFTGDTTTLVISTYLDPIAYWIQPVPPVYQTQITQVAAPIYLCHEGPGFFGGTFEEKKPVSLLSSNLSYSDFQIAPNSTALFALGVRFSCTTEGTGGPNYAWANLLVTCPGLRLTERVTES
jgi:hypothetical protein